MKCNKLTLFVMLQLCVWSGHTQQQPQQHFGNTPLYNQQQLGGSPDQQFKGFQPSGFGHAGGGKIANNLDMNNGNNMKYRNVKFTGTPVIGPGPHHVQEQGPPPQQPQQLGNMGLGTSGTQPPQSEPGNRVRGPGGVRGPGVLGGGPGNGNGPLRNGNGKGGRPMEQQQQPAPAQALPSKQTTFAQPRPKTKTTISFGTAFATPPVSQQSSQATPPRPQPEPAPTHFSSSFSSNNNNGEGIQQQQVKSSQEKHQTQSQANINQFTTFPQSNSVGLSSHNPNLSSTLATNTFGLSPLNSWNTQSHLVNNNNNNGGGGGGGGGVEVLNGNGNGNGNRFKVSSIDINNQLSQNVLDSNNMRFNSLQIPNENPISLNGGFKFPIDDTTSPILQDNRFGPDNDGFGNTGSASSSSLTTVNFGIGVNGIHQQNAKNKATAAAATTKNSHNNTPKKGKFSWISPEGQMYEISYVADLKADTGTGAAGESLESGSFYKSSTFPYPTNGHNNNKNLVNEPFSSGSTPSEYLVNTNSHAHFQPYNNGQNVLMMPSSQYQQQRFAAPVHGY